MTAMTTPTTDDCTDEIDSLATIQRVSAELHSHAYLVAEERYGHPDNWHDTWETDLASLPVYPLTVGQVFDLHHRLDAANTELGEMSA